MGLSSSLPQYCENYPVIKGDLESFKNELKSRKNYAQSYTLCHENQQVSVGPESIVNYWSDIEEFEYDKRMKKFEDKLRQKVFKTLASSLSPYKNLYQKENCLHRPGIKSKSEIDLCERKQNFVPKCNDSEYQEILESVENDYTDYREQEAMNALEENNSDRALNEAYGYLDQQKKLNFMKSHIQNTLLSKKLFDELEKEKERFNHEFTLTQKRNDCQEACRDGEQPGYNPCVRCKENKKKLLAELKDKHKQKSSKIKLGLGKIYEKNPALFELKNAYRPSFSELISTSYEKSDFAKKLKNKLIENHPSLKEMNFNEAQDFISSFEGQEALAQTASKAINSNDPELEILGREKVFEEKRKKIEALEGLCQGEIDDLHHYPGIAESVLEQTLQDFPGQSDELVKDQAAYCHLLQTRPPDEEAGLALGTVLGASALALGGVAVQFIPGLGQVAGASSIGLAASIVGGGVLTYDSLDRYSSSSQKHKTTMAAYHASTAWADSTELLESRSNLKTNSAIAGAEVALMAVDGVLVVKPAINLAKKLKSKRSVAKAKSDNPTMANDPDKPNPEFITEANLYDFISGPLRKRLQNDRAFNRSLTDFLKVSPEIEKDAFMTSLRKIDRIEDIPQREYWLTELKKSLNRCGRD